MGKMGELEAFAHFPHKEIFLLYLSPHKSAILIIMSDTPQKITFLGKIDHRDKQLTFGIREKDRTKHTYIIGKSGMGKSTLLENLIIQDINNGEGICVIDPHGSLAETILHYIPESRIKDVIYFAPFDGEFPMGLNMLEKVPAEKRYLLANGMMSAFKKIFTDGDGKGTFSARMEYVLNNIILALLENDGQTMLGINRMLFDKDYRKFIVSNVTDPTVRDFWVNEYANYTEKTAQELAPSIQNKIGQFVSNPLIRNIIGQRKTSFDIRKIMDEKKIFIANLSKGKVGEGNANLLGSLLITKIYLAAMSRADVDVYEAEKLPPCYFYVDEFQNFANESFASILSEARKYKLALTVAHQYIEQMTDEVKSAVFGNVGTMITFRIGATDAEVFEKEFAPKFVLDDFVNLSAYQIYLRLMIDGQGSQPFSAITLPRPSKPAHSNEQAVIAYSRTTYAKQKFLVEDEIMDFYKPAPKVEKPKVETPGVDTRYLKVQESKTETPYPPKRNERNDLRDKNNNITRYDTPTTSVVKKEEVILSPVTDSEKQQENKEAVIIKEKTLNASSFPKKEYPQEENQRRNPYPREERNNSYKPNSQKRDDGFVSTTKPKLDYVDTYKGERKDFSQPKERPTLTRFDDKPAMSLKEALLKAMVDQKPVSENKETDTKEEISVTNVVEKTIYEEKKTETISFSHENKNDDSSYQDSEKKKEEDQKDQEKVEKIAKEEQKRKEVAEEVLRKLLED